MDQNRHKILEATISIPTPRQLNYCLPDLEAARYLVDSFFTNVSCWLSKALHFVSRIIADLLLRSLVSLMSLTSACL